MIGTIAGLRAHHDLRGHPGPTAATDADATAALNRASDYVSTSFDLTVEETDERVISAAYIAAGFEIAADGTLVANPGFWVFLQSGKTLTSLGELGWTLTKGHSVVDGVSASNLVKNALRGTYASGGYLARA